MHASQRWRPWHRFNSWLGRALHLRALGLRLRPLPQGQGPAAGDGPRRAAKARALRRLTSTLLFPLLAGAHWKSVLAGRSGRHGDPEPRLHRPADRQQRGARGLDPPRAGLPAAAARRLVPVPDGDEQELQRSQGWRGSSAAAWTGTSSTTCTRTCRRTGSTRSPAGFASCASGTACATRSTGRSGAACGTAFRTCGGCRGKQKPGQPEVTVAENEKEEKKAEAGARRRRSSSPASSASISSRGRSEAEARRRPRSCASRGPTGRLV